MKAKKAATKSAQIVIRIEEKDRELLEQEAAENSRRLGDYLRILILTHPGRPAPATAPGPARPQGK